MSRFATLLLDLDGTLVDAFVTIQRSYAHVLPKFGVPAPTMEQVRRAVGGGLENAMRNFLPESEIPAAVAMHLAHTDSILLEDVRLLPGARELVAAQHAAGVQLAVFTNKRGNQARLICDHLGLTPFLKGVYGAKDTAWLKPQPEFAAHVLTVTGADARTTMLVGDSPFDVAAAHNGGFPCWCVTTGTHDETQLRAEKADQVFSDLFALNTALEKTAR